MKYSERAEVHAATALEAAGQLDDDCGGFRLDPEFVLAKAALASGVYSRYSSEQSEPRAAGGSARATRSNSPDARSC